MNNLNVNSFSLRRQISETPHFLSSSGLNKDTGI